MSGSSDWWFSKGNPAIDALTEFEAFESAAEDSTTSDDLIVKSGFPYTTDTKSAGEYVIDYSFQVQQSNANKQMGYAVEWRVGTSGTWTRIVDVVEEIARGGFYNLRSGFVIVDLLSASVFQIRILFGDTDAGGTAFMKLAAIKVGKVAT